MCAAGPPVPPRSSRPHLRSEGRAPATRRQFYQPSRPVERTARPAVSRKLRQNRIKADTVFIIGQLCQLSFSIRIWVLSCSKTSKTRNVREIIFQFNCLAFCHNDIMTPTQSSGHLLCVQSLLLLNYYLSCVLTCVASISKSVVTGTCCAGGCLATTAGNPGRTALPGAQSASGQLCCWGGRRIDSGAAQNKSPVLLPQIFTA